MKTVFKKYEAFWLFLIFFKFGGNLHYTILAPLGEKILPLWIVGLILGGGSLIQLVLDVPAGHIMDKYGYIRFLKITTFTFLLAAVCFMFGLTWTTFILSFFFSTFGWLFFGPGTNAYVLSNASKDIAGEFMSMHDIFGSVGVVLSSIAFALLAFVPVEQIGVMIFIIFFTAYVLLFFVPQGHRPVLADEKKIDTQHHYVRRSFLLTTLKAFKRLNPASGVLLLLRFSGSVFYSTVWFVVPLIIVSKIENNMLSIGLGIFDFSIVALGFLLGTLADKWNKRLLVFYGLLLFALSGMLISFSFNWLFLVFGFLATTGDEMASLSLWAWLHALDKNHDHDGLISGIMKLFEDFGWAVGPILAGFTYGIFGPTWAVFIGAAPVFISWIIYFIYIKVHFRHLSAQEYVPIKPYTPRHKT